jgi:type IV pilus assembly protein PilW
MTALARRRPRGATLVELLVATAVSAIVLAALFGVVQSQQAAYYEGHLQRAAQASARSALTYVEKRVQLAGYGMDAPLAFDFTRYGLDKLLPAPCPLPAGCARDDVAENDELVFYARNPRYWLPEIRTAEPRGNAWRVTSIAGDTLTVNARPGDVFHAGRVLQLVCKDALRYAYVTVGALAGPVPEDGAVPPDRPLPMRLFPAVPADPFRRQDTTLAAIDPCFTNGEARAFLIDRYRFHVRPMAVGERVQPFLVLDTGLDENGDGVLDELDEVVIAEGIESFQVGYVMTNAALAPRGTVPGTRIEFVPGLPGATAGDRMTTLQFPGPVAPGGFEYAPTSWFGYAVGPTPSVANERLTDHQANIRGVRISMVARGPEPDPAAAREEVFAPVLNQNVRPAWIPADVPYNRVRVETTVLVRNMIARALNEF